MRWPRGKLPATRLGTSCGGHEVNSLPPRLGSFFLSVDTQCVTPCVDLWLQLMVNDSAAMFKHTADL